MVLNESQSENLWIWAFVSTVLYFYIEPYNLFGKLLQFVLTNPKSWRCSAGELRYENQTKSLPGLEGVSQNVSLVVRC